MIQTTTTVVETFQVSLVGKRFGRLRILSERKAIQTGRMRLKVTYICDCGKSKEVWADGILKGRSRSCGCLHRDILKKGYDITSPTWHSWQNIKGRCNPKTKLHQRKKKHYGHVTVCDRWLGNDGYKNFLSDMGERPNGKSIDRIDNEKGYSPDNCRWSTPKEQVQNRRVTLRVLVDGNIKTAAEFAEMAGICYNTAFYFVKSLHRIRQFPQSKMRKFLSEHSVTLPS